MAEIGKQYSKVSKVGTMFNQASKHLAAFKNASKGLAGGQFDDARASVKTSQVICATTVQMQWQMMLRI